MMMSIGVVVTKLNFLIKIRQRDISSSGWDIFLKFFGDIPGMLVHHFQIILNFLYVSQSVSWLTSLLKIHKYRDLSSSGWDIFLKFFGHIPGMLVHYLQIIPNLLYVCQSVSWLTFLQKIDKYRDISSSGSDVSLDFFGDIPEMLVHWFQMILNFLYGNQSGSWHTPFMKSNKFRDISNSWWDIFVNFCRQIPGMLIHFLQIIQNF